MQSAELFNKYDGENMGFMSNRRTVLEINLKTHPCLVYISRFVKEILCSQLNLLHNVSMGVLHHNTDGHCHSLVSGCTQ